MRELPQPLGTPRVHLLARRIFQRNTVSLLFIFPILESTDEVDRFGTGQQPTGTGSSRRLGVAVCDWVRGVK